jgi:hypothetical protein
MMSSFQANDYDDSSKAAVHPQEDETTDRSEASVNGAATHDGKHAHFWQEPPEEDTWFVPPQPHGQNRLQVEKHLLEMRAMMEQHNLPAHAIDLLWKYHTGADIAQRELRLVYEETGEELSKLHQEYRTKRDEWRKAREDFVAAFSASRLSWYHEPAIKGKNEPGTPQALSAPTGNDGVSLMHIEDALRHNTPTPQEICGQDGIEPVSTEMRWYHRLYHLLMETFAPLAAGFLLGLNISIITGLLELSDLKRGDRLWLFMIAGIIGLCVEKLLGESHYNLFGSLSRRIEPRQQAHPDKIPFPYHRSTLLVGVLLSLLFIVDIATLTVDALGLRMLHLQNIADQKFLNVQADTLLPMYVYLIIGTIVSMPYLFYKAIKGWKDSESKLRESAIIAAQRAYMENKRGEPDVQNAFRLAQRAHDLQSDLQEIQGRISLLRTTRDAARTAATGETGRFHQYWDILLGCIETLQEPGSKRNPRSTAPREQRPSLLSRILGLFGRRD